MVGIVGWVVVVVVLGVVGIMVGENVVVNGTGVLVLLVVVGNVNGLAVVDWLVLGGWKVEVGCVVNWVGCDWVELGCVGKNVLDCCVVLNGCTVVGKLVVEGVVKEVVVLGVVVKAGVELLNGPVVGCWVVLVLVLELVGCMVDVGCVENWVVLEGDPVVDGDAVEVELELVGADVVVLVEVEVPRVGTNMVVVSGLNLPSSKLLVVGRLHSVVGFSENNPLVVVLVVVVVVVDLKLGRFVTFLNLWKKSGVLRESFP